MASIPTITPAITVRQTPGVRVLLTRGALARGLPARIVVRLDDDATALAAHSWTFAGLPRPSDGLVYVIIRLVPQDGKTKGGGDPSSRRGPGVWRRLTPLSSPTIRVGHASKFLSTRRATSKFWRSAASTAAVWWNSAPDRARSALPLPTASEAKRLTGR